MAEAWIGTSGYDYRHWVGEFYPAGMPEREWFGYYAGHLDAVELNVTFYGLPKREAFEHWAAAAPEHFRFVLKGSRYVTHVKRLKDVGGAVERLLERAAPLGDRLGAVLWQLPGWFKADSSRLSAFLGQAGDAPHGRGVRHAFEFRDPSWFCEATYEALAAHDAAVVLADWPFQVLAPGMGRRRLDRPVVRVPHTAGWVYLRRHGPGDPYGSGYSPSMVRTDAAFIGRCLAGELDALAFYKKEAFVSKIGQAHDEARSGASGEAYAFYNNDAWGYGVRDALMLARLVRSRRASPAPSHPGTARRLER